jgi:hypothetical protein
VSVAPDARLQQAMSNFLTRARGSPGRYRPDVRLLLVAMEGSGEVLTPRVFRVPITWTGRFVDWILLADFSGNLSIQIQRTTFATYPAPDPTAIAPSAVGPQLVSSNKARAADFTLTGWSPNVTDGDILLVNIVGIPTLITSAVLGLRYVAVSSI